MTRQPAPQIDYSNNNDELFNSTMYWVPKNPSKGWVGNFTNIKGDSGVAKEEETYVKNYGNPLTESQLKRVLFVLEENEEKISFKVYRYVSTRGVGKKYFKVRKQIYFLTFNYKKKLLELCKLLLLVALVEGRDSILEILKLL